MTEPDLDALLDGFAARFAARGELVERAERARSLAPVEREAERRAIAEETARADAEDDAVVRAFVDRRRTVDVRAALARLSSHALDDSPHYGDEALDAFVERLLGTHGRYDGGARPGVEMIHYDPSPASAALALAARGWFDAGEVFVDLGSGTGRVITLASLLGPARTVGVEIDEPLVRIHRAAAARLDLPVDVRVGDARTAKLEDGTRFFFFAPFLGSVLDAVLGRLEALSRTRQIHVGSWGPSTEAIARAPFLVPDRAAPYSSFDLATFRTQPGSRGA